VSESWRLVKSANSAAMSRTLKRLSLASLVQVSHLKRATRSRISSYRSGELSPQASQGVILPLALLQALWARVLFRKELSRLRERGRMCSMSTEAWGPNTSAGLNMPPQ